MALNRLASHHSRAMARRRFNRAAAPQFQQTNVNLITTRKRRSGWSSPGEPERDLNTRDRHEAMAKARQKVEESPIVAGLVQTLADNIVGSGFTLKMKTKDPGFNKEVEALWAQDKDRLDVRGVRTWSRLQRCWFCRKDIDGDVGWILMDGGVTEDRVRSYVQTIESERIYRDPYGADDTGIRFNKFGRPVAYYVGPRPVVPQTGARKKGKPVKAENFVHYAHFPHERAERARGVSKLLTNLNMFEDLEQILDGIVQKVKNEAFIGLKFFMQPGPNGELFGPAGPQQVEEEKKSEDGRKRRHVKLIPGVNVNCEEGENVDVLQMKSPNQQVVPFLRFILRYMGTAFGLPLEMLLMDFADTNFSGGRALMELAKKRFRVEQNELGVKSSRTLTWWLSRETKHNGLKVPSKIANSYWTHEWGMPGWPYLNPMQEVQAHGLALDRGLTTRRDILAEIGTMDVEEIVEQLKHEQKLFTDAGLPIISGLPGSNIINIEALKRALKDGDE